MAEDDNVVDVLPEFDVAVFEREWDHGVGAPTYRVHLWAEGTYLREGCSPISPEVIPVSYSTDYAETEADGE